ncbi:MAG: hypothetical protein ACM3X1_09500 [Ignavibacteriales bacterium]
MSDKNTSNANALSYRNKVKVILTIKYFLVISPIVWQLSYYFIIDNKKEEEEEKERNTPLQRENILII